jgi:RimJ/RimL family protein N-acetyltransferase
MRSERVKGLGVVSIRAIDDAYPRPKSASVYDNWGDFAPEAAEMKVSRWLVELTNDVGGVIPVGDLSAHAAWYGPTPGSRAMNIGISLVEEHRGRGIGAVAQKLLATELHEQGIVRVEASTDITNVPEQRSLEKAGFSYEGTLRKAQSRADGLHDLQVWAHTQN